MQQDKFSWQRIKERINRGSIRERILTFFTGSVLLWGFYYSMFSSLQEQKHSLREENNHLQELSIQHNSNSNYSKNKDEYLYFESQFSKNQDILRQYQGYFSQQKNIPTLLERLVNEFPNLKFVNLEIKPQYFDVNHHLVKQQIKIICDGDYGTLLNYLNKIEKSEFPFWWEELEYAITAFPQAKIALTFYVIVNSNNDKKN